MNIRVAPLIRCCTMTLGIILAAKVGGQVFVPFLSRTFNNPTPEAFERFGYAVATLGGERVIIGAAQDNRGAVAAGAAYLYHTNGSLLCTFTNPTPAASDGFGVSVAVVGTDKILIGANRDDTGATDAGAAYLFDTNGTLLTTFTNPSPVTLAPFNGENFGFAVAALGTDKVLIGARGAGDFIHPGVGEAYLFTATGTLITTFSNPPPVVSEQFGRSLAAVGTDRVLIGAPGNGTQPGVAYLFSTNGAWLATCFSPTPAAGEGFGGAVAVVGSDRLVVGAGGPGEVDVFDTNGILSVTITNPDPSANELFGTTMAGVSTNQILIGAPQDTPGAFGVFRTGTAYLFGTDGTLWSTINNPTPEGDDYFGNAIAPLGTDKVIIGAYQDNTGASGAGSTYLFSLTPPFLRIDVLGGGSISLMWFRPATAYVLESCTNLVAAVWTQVPFPYQTNGSRISVTVNASGNCYYRLRH